MNNRSVFFSKTSLLALLAAFTLAGTSCEKEDDVDAKADGPPTVTGLRAYAAAPNDSLITRVSPGTVIVIEGTKLKTTRAVLLDGYPATFNSALFADNSIVVNVPADIPFASLDPALYNKIQVVTSGGETTYDFPVSAPAPVLSAASNEMAKPGETITITGNFLYLIKKITFPGSVDATEFKANTGGTELQVKVPQSTQAGPVRVQTEFGTTTSVFHMNDMAGTLLNFDNANPFDYGCLVTNDASAFPGANGKYARLMGEGIGNYNWSYDDGKRAIFSKQVDWLPASELNQPAANYAMKFEIFVKEPLSTGCLFIGPPPGGSWAYMARYEPWKTTPNYKTAGWTTVSIPFDQFKLKANGADGTGAGAATVNDLVGSINEVIKFMYVNDTATPLAKLDIAVDNIRVVKIK
ncbi:glycan-binding surface protein [Hymenobacter sp.]|jgi:hypothetical protein|uniref:glycan-binding surface protein n=1 Tax=Hymenobacter sp. TaxID=1898978 RepID=UPI002ED9AEFB